MNFEIKELSKTSLPVIFDFSFKLFSKEDPNEENVKSFHDLEKWESKFDRNGSLLGAYSGDSLVGFCFSHDKGPDMPGALHIYLAGVSPEYRRLGIMSSLFTKVESIAKQKGYKYLTINTSKAKFPAMYNFLVKGNFEIITENPDRSEFKKTL